MSLEEQGEVLQGYAEGAAGGSSRDLELLIGLIDEHRLARAVIRRIVVDDRDAEDVHQDVLIRVAQGIDGYRGEARFTTWLYAVARNTALSHVARRRDHVELSPETHMTAQHALSSVLATRADLQVALNGLPDHYREPVYRRDIEGQSYAEIAEALEIEVNTVRSRLARGRALVARAARPDDLVS